VTDKKWYYSKSGKEYKGPVSTNNLSSKIEEQVVSEDTLVWKEGFSDWKSISDTAEFEEKFKKTTPPPLPRKDENKNRVEESNASDFLFDSESESNKKDSDSTDEETEQTNRWLKFYVNFRIPFAIFITLINVLDPPPYYISDEKDLFRIIGLGIILIYLVLFWGLYKRKLWGWKFNWSFIFVEPLLGPFGVVSNPILLFIYITGGIILYSFPNYIYFKKRKHLFS